MTYDLSEKWRAEIEELAEKTASTVMRMWSSEVIDSAERTRLEQSIYSASTKIAAKMRALKTVAEMDEEDRNKAQGGA